MKRIKLYLQDAYNELVNKVTWPKWSELQASGIVVMVATVILSIVVFVMDFSFENIMKLIYGMFY
jgi:preprotein translocase subunit SecE